jgi:hypothetical protein
MGSRYQLKKDAKEDIEEERKFADKTLSFGIRYLLAS